MKKIAVLCKDGFEEIEALTPVDVLRRANVHVDLVGMDDLKVTSSHKLQFKGLLSLMIKSKNMMELLFLVVYLEQQI